MWIGFFMGAALLVLLVWAIIRLVQDVVPPAKP
jgi:hypothetical protein